MKTKMNEKYVSRLNEMLTAPMTIKKIVPGPRMELTSIANW